MADVTLQEKLYKQSVRKFFIDYLVTTLSKHVYFDRQYSIPKDSSGDELTNWVSVGFDGIDIDTVSTGMLEVLCFSRKDEGGIVLSELRDIIVDMMIDETMSDGCTRVPYYNSSWVQVGGMVAYVDTKDGGVQYGADGTMFKIINVTLRWGTK
jgi:hypothetical protein